MKNETLKTIILTISALTLVAGGYIATKNAIALQKEVTYLANKSKAYSGFLMEYFPEQVAAYDAKLTNEAK